MMMLLDHEKIKQEKRHLIDALKMAYRKHHLQDESIDSQELSGVMRDTLCEAMGEKEYRLWLNDTR